MRPQPPNRPLELKTKRSGHPQAAHRRSTSWMLSVVAMLGLPAPSWSQFKEPVLTEIASSGGSTDWSANFSGDMLEVVWTAHAANNSNWEIWSSRRENIDAPWEEAQPVDVINTNRGESGPHLSYDGLTLTYASYGREGGYGGLDLWQTHRASRDEPWQEPVNMGPTINTRSNDGGATFSNDGLEMIFSAGCPGGGQCSPSSLRRSTRETLDGEWTTPEELTRLGRGDLVGAAAQHSLSPDGLSLYFNTNGNFGNWDVFVSKRPTLDAPFGRRENLGATINTSGRDTGVRIAPDGSLYYGYGWNPGQSRLRIWRAEAALAGDVDLDGEVSFGDFLALSGNFGGAGDWSHGDFDGNGKVEFPDFLLLSENFGQALIDTSAVPEPATSPILLAGVVAALGLRQRFPIRTTQPLAADA